MSQIRLKINSHHKALEGKDKTKSWFSFACQIQFAFSLNSAKSITSRILEADKFIVPLGFEQIFDDVNDQATNCPTTTLHLSVVL